MISLITCSIKPDVCKKMLDSVSKTIGTEYEAIVFDNREKQYGICKAYNEAANNANGDYLCFVHEDIEIKSNDWGKNLMEFVDRTEKCGAIGLAGGHFVPQNFVCWMVNRTSPMNLYDPSPSDNQEYKHIYYNPDNEVFSKVVCIDGVFMFVKKSVWEANQFDESAFKGFHFYDADFSLAVAHEYQNYVYFGMEVHHFSGGNMDKSYCEDMFLFQKKWKNSLPFSLPGYKVSIWEELNQAENVFYVLRKNGFSILESLQRICQINGVLFVILFLAKRGRRAI